MARKEIDLTTPRPTEPGKPQRAGESPKSAFQKINDMTLELYQRSGGTGSLPAGSKALINTSNLDDVSNRTVARQNLGLGSAAIASLAPSSETPSIPYDGYAQNAGSRLNGTGTALTGGYANGDGRPSGWYSDHMDAGGLPAGFGGAYYHKLRDSRPIQFGVSYVTGEMISRGFVGAGWTAWRNQLSSGNTTVDSNGFIKRASPIIKLFNDKVEKTDDLEITETEFERIDTGVYKLTNAPRLSRDGWYIETPKDRNGNVYFTLDYEENEGELIIRTYEPDYSTGRAANGEPVDIPEGRFISLRFEEDPSLYPAPEMPDGDYQPPHNPDDDKPYVPQSVPRAQAMVVMIQSGVWDLAVDYIEAIEDPTEKAIAKVALYETNNYRRDSPFLLLAGDAIGLDDTDIDNLFIAAEQVKL